MKLYVKRSNSVILEEGREYFGWIDSYKVLDDGRLWVFVVLEEDENCKGLYSVYINTNENSEFIKFCEKMYIVDDEDEIHLDWLVEEDCPVWVEFRKMPDGKMLIQSMHWDEDVLEELMEENENG